MKKATTIDDIQHVINTYMRDHRIGLPRGTPGPMICRAEREEGERKQHGDKTEVSKPEDTPTQLDNTINTDKCGGGKGDGGQRKGYGQCWERAKWDTLDANVPCSSSAWAKEFRETTQWLHSKVPANTEKKVAKGVRAKASGTYNGYYGSKGYTGYTSPGKAIGKGLNYWGEDDYAAAWGNDEDYHYNNYGGEEWNYGYGDMNHPGNHMMLLEAGINTMKTDINSKEMTTITTTKAVPGRRDPLRGASCAKPVTTQNRYGMLTNYDDSDCDDDDNVTPIDRPTTSHQLASRRLSIRPRRQIQRLRADEHDHDNHNEFDIDAVEDEAVRDAATSSDVLEADWVGIASTNFPTPPECNVGSSATNIHNNNSTQAIYREIVNKHLTTTCTQLQHDHTQLLVACLAIMIIYNPNCHGMLFEPFLHPIFDGVGGPKHLFLIFDFPLALHLFELSVLVLGGIARRRGLLHIFTLVLFSVSVTTSHFPLFSMLVLVPRRHFSPQGNSLF